MVPQTCTNGPHTGRYWLCTPSNIYRLNTTERGECGYGDEPYIMGTETQATGLGHAHQGWEVGIGDGTQKMRQTERQETEDGNKLLGPGDRQ